LIAELDADIRVAEPHVASHPRIALMPVERAIEDADIVVFLVGHRAFRQIPPNLLAEKLIIDPVGFRRTMSA
jgi:UDP-N-acetyl-D-mannosaminuronic acid dehydrogenase